MAVKQKKTLDASKHEQKQFLDLLLQLETLLATTPAGTLSWCILLGIPFLGLKIDVIQISDCPLSSYTE